MLQRITLYFVILLVGFSAQAQDRDKMKLAGLVPGEITFENGKTMKGYIRQVGIQVINGVTMEAKWRLQHQVLFMMEHIFERRETFDKNCFIELQPKDLEQIKYNGEVYRKLIFLDHPNRYCCEPRSVNTEVLVKVIAEERINLYEYYYRPCSNNAQVSMLNEIDDPSEPDILWNTGNDKKAKRIAELNINKQLRSCPVVMEKLRNNGYIPDAVKPSKSLKIKLRNKYRKQVMLMAVADYNSGVCE